MCTVTYEMIQEVHENCVHSRIQVLNSGRGFASSKCFGRLFHMIAPLKAAASSTYAQLLFSFNNCFPLRW